MASLEERCKQRTFVKPNVRYYSYRGREHDLYIALPDYSDLQRCFEIIFDKLGQEPPYIMFRKKRYDLVEPPLLTEDNGYYCIQGKVKGSKGLHKIPLHKLAYTAFYGVPPVGYHIHHIDRNKHNNAADNLVALTEGEHSTVHGRNVSVGRTLFTPPLPKKDLLHNQPAKKIVLQPIQKQEPPKPIDSITITGGIADFSIALSSGDVSIGRFDQPKLIMTAEVAAALSQEFTEQNMKTAIAKVFNFRLERIRQNGTPMTVLDVLCEMANKENE